VEQSRKKITVDEKTKSVIKDTSSITFTNPKISRDRKLTYSGRLYVECEHKITTRRPAEEEKVYTRSYPTTGFGYIPILTKSDYCALAGKDAQSLYQMGEDPSDPGGYFITNGGEKVIIAQERMRYNHIFVFKKTSTSNKPIYEAEVRSIKEMSFRPASLVAARFKAMKGLPTVRIIGLPYLRQGQEIPLSILFKALGITSDEEMCFLITHDMKDAEMLSLLRGTIREGNKEAKTQEEALNYIGMRTTNAEKDKTIRIQYVRDLLTRELFPHVGDEYASKAFYLGMFTKELLDVSLGRKEQSDRDHYAQKRVSTVGQLLGELTAQILQKMMKDLRNTLIKYLNEGRPIDVSALIKEKAITQGLKYAISTGNWSANKIAGNKSGVSAVLMRLSFISTISHLRRLNTPVGRDGKLSKPRHLSGTHWGMVSRDEFVCFMLK
jgi:DNA-directed RNA polymerase II subunit RPB2